MLLLWSLNSCGEQAIFKLDIKKKSGLSLNPDIHHSKVFSSDHILKHTSFTFTRKTSFHSEIFPALTEARLVYTPVFAPE